MISFRTSDILKHFVDNRKKLYDCRLQLIFPMDENDQNESDRNDSCMGILNLELPSIIPMKAFMDIRAMVNEVLSPNAATISIEHPEDNRKFYSDGNQSIREFEADSLGKFKGKISKISNGPVTDNISQYISDDESDRITISFKILA